MAQAVAIQPYVTIERFIQDQAQIIKVNEYELHLFETRITSSNREFAMDRVYDMSFKMINGEEGFLYLHTNEGVHSFRVRDNPKSFMRAFRDLKKR